MEDDCANQRKLARAAIEKLETVKDIIDERNTLKKKLEESQHELETLRVLHKTVISKVRNVIFVFREKSNRPENHVQQWKANRAKPKSKLWKKKLRN